MWLQMALIRSYLSWHSQPTKAPGVRASTVLPSAQSEEFPLSARVQDQQGGLLQGSFTWCTRQRYGPSGGVFLTLDVTACNAPGPESPRTLLKVTEQMPQDADLGNPPWNVECDISQRDILVSPVVSPVCVIVHMSLLCSREHNWL